MNNKTPFPGIDAKDCPKCMANGAIPAKALPSHPCPYQADVNDDDQFRCECCEECIDECADDI